MGAFDKIAGGFSAFGQTLASVAKIILLSRRPTVKRSAGEGDELVVLGNGPSLNTTVEESLPFLMARKRLAVNFAASTPLFMKLRPDYYVLADPHFFVADTENVRRLWDVLADKVDWQMTLFLPVGAKGERVKRVARNGNVRICRYNLTPVEGFRGFRNAVYRLGWGMPRPRNVLIPSLMLALDAGFKTIYVAGADHSWTKTLSVDEENHVVSVQPHFYKDNDRETTRIRTEYLGYPLHKILYSFYVAFRSYYVIRDYAASLHATIWNITPGSFIDAFPRRKPK